MAPGLEAADEFGGIRPEEHAFDLRLKLSHDLDLRRVVVGEDEAVHANAEFIGDPLQVVGLRVPVGFEGREVLQPENHLGMLLEYLDRAHGRSCCTPQAGRRVRKAKGDTSGKP